MFIDCTDNSYHFWINIHMHIKINRKNKKENWPGETK